MPLLTLSVTGSITTEFFYYWGLLMQVNTTTYVEITIHQEQLREDDNSIGGVLLRLTPAEARQLARELNEATRKGKK